MVATGQSSIALVERATQELLDWAEQVHHSDETILHKAQTLATRLGAHYRADGLTEIGFWAPELGADMFQPKNIYLEVLTPKGKIDPAKPKQRVTFRREYVQLEKQGEYFWGVISGMRPGHAEQFGSFYWLRYLDFENELRTIGDFLAYSLPFGAYAPAELYDMSQLQSRRADLDYFEQGDRDADGVIRVHPPRNILQLHIGTVSPEGTLAGLARIYRRIAEKLVAQEPLTPAEQNYVGYDAVQLLPIEPTVEYLADHEIGQGFFVFSEADIDEMDPDDEDIDYEAGDIKITLKKPNIQNWGYDIVIFGSSATNPAVLSTLRPDELIDFISVLHNFPTGPIQVIYDIVYGHADNQALDLLNGRFLKGPNMYGQDVNHQNPTVRAILLEMQRRKNNTGVDGIRVDGAQDFKFFNPLSGRVEYDDSYLNDMAEVIQEIGDAQRKPFAIFEDGRPWPAEGWEDVSTYRDIIEYKPDAFQWGPLIFAHNTPTLTDFWDKKWRRVCEVMQVGENWVTGCGNHDTLRRGTQIDPDLPVNWNLGQNLPEILNNAYDNPAIALLIYGFSPGLPMDFINCTMRAPWGFLRNTDDRYGVKVVSEEAGGFLDWQVLPEYYQETDAFPRLKQLGFMKLKELRQFMRGLYEAIQETNYDLEEVAHICRACLGLEASAATELQDEQRSSIAELKKLNIEGKSKVLTEIDIAKLKAIAHAFMEDAHDLSNVWHHADLLNPDQTTYNLALRRFRQANPWLQSNFSGSDRFNRISDDHQTIFYGLRTAPSVTEESDTTYQIALVAHMGGDPVMATLGDWLQINLDEWKVAIASPGLVIGEDTPLQSFELHDSQALLLERIH
ncbi:MAG: glucosylglycerol hydrolase [Elainellaceae cyanobacterium]